VREGSKSKKFDREKVVEVGREAAPSNAKPKAGENTQPSQQRITERMRTRVGFTRSIFLLKTPGWFRVARADSVFHILDSVRLALPRPPNLEPQYATA
jgi:hypothetical protein